jgi:hypothetical protein
MKIEKDHIMAKNETSKTAKVETAKVESKEITKVESPEVATEEEEATEDTGIVVDIDAVTGLPITKDVEGNLIPKIPKAYFKGEHVKVDNYTAKTAILEYYLEMAKHRLEEHKALKDPAKAKAMKIARMKAELARLMAEA